MDIKFVEKRAQITDKIREYAEKKLARLDRYFRKDCDATVKFLTQREIQTVEITIVYNSIVFRAHESTDDMFVSIDKAIEALIRQIHKNKTRLEKRLRSGAFERTAHDVEPQDTADASILDIEEEEIAILRTKRFPLKPMTPEEAIMQMNLLGHEFFAFKNSSSLENFAVVYKRNDGGYGLIEDE